MPDPARVAPLASQLDSKRTRGFCDNQMCSLQLEFKYWCHGILAISQISRRFVYLILKVGSLQTFPHNFNQ